MVSFPADDLIPSITGAIHDASKLPAALVSKSPGAALVTWHGIAAVYTYYAVLLGTVAFGLVEATFGFWVLPRDLPHWNMAAKVLLYVTLLPLAVVLSLLRRPETL